MSDARKAYLITLAFVAGWIASSILWPGDVPHGTHETVQEDVTK